MKRYFSLISILLFFLFVLLFPTKTFFGATNGLILWYRTILPTLLPFIICSNLLISTHTITYISKISSPIFQKLLCVSNSSCYAILVGFLCGYPLGAKAVCDLLKEDYISLTEAKYLLSFCNNASPMFIISYIVLQTLHDTKLCFPTLFILLLSPLLCSFLFRRIYKISLKHTSTNNFSKRTFRFNFIIFDNCISNALETIAKIAGYMIIFSILIAFFEHPFLRFFAPLFELSNGVTQIANWNLSFPVAYILILSLTSFGGFCAIAQTGAVLKNSKISILPYIAEKLITTVVTSFLAYVYICFIHQ